LAYIYQIRNTKNGRRYIGQTNQLAHRRSCHRYELKHNKHKNELLQQDYNDDPDSIVFEILCECPVDELDELERHFIRKYDAIASGYNKSPGRSENGGNIVSEETARKLSAMNMGNKYMVGKKLSLEWKRHLSEAQPHKKRIRCIDTGEIFDSFADAARKTGLNRTKIVSVCTGKRNKTGGMRFEYADKQDTYNVEE